MYLSEEVLELLEEGGEDVKHLRKALGLQESGKIDLSQICCKLLKSPYGLKQAPRLWQQDVIKFFKKLRLLVSDADPSLFVKKTTNGEIEILILACVDDMPIVGDSQTTADMVRAILSNWKGEDLGPVSVFIGYELTRIGSSIVLSQRRYIEKLLHRFGMAEANAVKLPVPGSTVLALRENETDLEEADILLFRQVVGSLIYLGNGTRFDISYAIGQLARNMSNPHRADLELAKKVLRYLKGTVNLTITYGKPQDKTHIPLIYTAYTDATFATEDDRKAFQGWIILWNRGAVSWRANRQQTTSQSSTEAELITANECARELAWFEKVMDAFGVKYLEPVI